MKCLITGSCIALLGLALTACLGGSNGDGNGDSTAEQAPRIEGPVDISGSTRAQPGASLRFELEGEFSEGPHSIPVNATFTHVTRQPEQFQGQTVIPTERSHTWRFPSEGSEFTTGATAYFSPDGQLIADVHHDGVSCFPTEGSARLPKQIEHGDEGFIYREACTDGSTTVSHWSASSGEGTLDLALTFETTRGSEDISEVQTYRFDENGTPRSLRLDGTIRQFGIQTHVVLEGPAVSVNL